MNFPIEYSSRHQNYNSSVYNYNQRVNKILIPINNYNNQVRISQPQIPKIINIPSLTNNYIYNNYKPINMKTTNYTNYMTYNNMLYNTVNNSNNLRIVKNIANSNNYIINPSKIIIVQKPFPTIPYTELIRYNK